MEDDAPVIYGLEFQVILRISEGYVEYYDCFNLSIIMLHKIRLWYAVVCVKFVLFLSDITRLYIIDAHHLKSSAASEAWSEGGVVLSKI